MYKKKKYIYGFLIIVIVVFSIKYISGSPKINPTELFIKIVTSPIPNSVSKIKADGYKDRRNNHRYILQFSIDRKDLTKIISDRQFKEAAYFECDHDYIYVGNIIGNKEDVAYQIVLNDRRRPPKWFKLEDWQKVEVYAMVEFSLNLSWIRFLAYNEELGIAYYYDEKKYFGVGIDLSPHWYLFPLNYLF